MRCVSRVSRAVARRTAATLLFLLLANAGPAWAQPGPTVPQIAPGFPQQYDQCMQLARGNPQGGLDQAEAWRNLGGGFPADHCAAVALIGLKKYADAATRLQNMAGAMMQADPVLRGGALEQAGAAWLMAGKPDAAKADFDAALAYRPDDPEILIDRAEASALTQKWFEAIDDLNRVLDKAPNRVDALIYRASAYRQLDSLDLAQDDVERALALQPDAPAGLLERGNIRRLKGDLAGAAADWRRAQSLAPNAPEGKSAADNLQRLAEAGAAPGKSPAPAAAKKP